MPSPGYSLVSPTLSLAVQADRQFIATLTFAPASTPYGELYRKAARQLCEAKTTFAQAN